MSRVTHDVLSVEWIKLELIRTAYATRGGLFARMDPRMVLAWYLVMSVAPWLTHNLTVLAGLFALGAAAVSLARVGPLVLGLFVITLGFEVVNVFAVAFFLGGTTDTLIALLELTLKLGVVSLASMAAFVSLDPDKLSSALLWLRAPALVAFAVSYGFRMLPILIEEFRTVMEGYNLRMARPSRRGFLGWRTVVHWAKLTVLAFYPIFLNLATSVRTTVEALETRGFNHAATDPQARRLRVAHLRTTALDHGVVAATFLMVIAMFLLGERWPVYR